MSINLKSEVRRIFSPKYYEVWDMGNTYILLLVDKILKQANITEVLAKKKMSIEQLSKELGFTPKAVPALAWLLSFASQNQLLTQVYADNRAFFSFSGKVLECKSEEIIKRILHVDPAWDTFIALTELISEDYPSFLRGKKRGLDILFLNERRKYWDDYFGNKYTAYRAFNELGASVLASLVDMNHEFSLLEIGGGTGGATEKVINTLKECNSLKNLRQYVFSDISPFFLKYGSRILANCLNENFLYETKKIDFNISFEKQGIPGSSFEIIYGVNALHVAKDLLGTIKNIISILRPGGSLVVCEFIRPRREKALYMEMIFNLLESYSDIEINPDFRHAHGFLTIADWTNVFHRAGFRSVEIIDDSLGAEDWKREKMAMALRGIK